MRKLIFDRHPLDADELEGETLLGDQQCVANLSGLIPPLRKINLKSLVREGELSPYSRVWGAPGKEEDQENS